MTAGVLSILLAALFVVGSLLDLLEYDRPFTQTKYGDYFGYHQVWRPWSFTSRGIRNFPGETQQLLGIAMIVVAVFAVLGGCLLLTGLARRYRPARAMAVSAASMAVGTAAALLSLVGTTLILTVRPATVSMRPGAWMFVVAVMVAVAALFIVLIGGSAAREAIPRDSVGRPLTPRAGGMDVMMGVLLIALAALAMAATFCHLRGETTMWWAYGGKTRIVGVPVAAGAGAALIAAVLLFTGRGRPAGCASAGALFGTGLLLSLDLVDKELFGPVGFGDLGVGAWLLFAATALALIVSVLGVVSAVSRTRYRTPNAPAAPPPNWGQSPQSFVPAQPGWPQVPPGWVLVPESSVQPQPGTMPQQ